jgi:hypothetical protein
MLNTNRQDKLEKCLRQARQQIWDNPDMDKVILWLKRNLQPYWNDRQANEKQLHDNRMLFIWD